MLSMYLLPGMKVELVPIVSGFNAQQNVKKYVSSIYEILSDDQIEVTMPMEQTKLILLSVDTEYDVYFYTKKGLYQCECRIADRYKSDNTYLLALDMITNLRKYQRREFYRFSCALDMVSRPLEAFEIESIERTGNYVEMDLPLKHSVIVDISGGGLRFIASQRYNADSLIYCSYHLNNNGTPKEYRIVGKILRVSELENKPGVFEHRVKYVKIKPADREEIIRYIFEEERKKRQQSR